MSNSDSTFFTKTAKGVRTLGNCGRLLTENECRILKLVNGKLTLEEIRTRLGTMSDHEYRKSMDSLQKGAYVRQLSNDMLDGPMTEVGVTELDSEHGVREWAAATRASDALSRQGYYLAREDKTPCTGPQQILVIDDDANIGEAASAVLSEAGFVVEWIADPRMAVDKIRGMPCLVLVLLDVVMPHENGFEVLRRIRSQANLHRLPVVMLTAHTNPEYVAEGLRDGADGYILKPFKPEKLLRYLQDTLKDKQ